MSDSIRNSVLHCLNSIERPSFIARVFQDSVAQEYAMGYVRMLQNRAKGIEGQIPRFPWGSLSPIAT